MKKSVTKDIRIKEEIDFEDGHVHTKVIEENVNNSYGQVDEVKVVTSTCSTGYGDQVITHEEREERFGDEANPDTILESRDIFEDTTFDLKTEDIVRLEHEVEEDFGGCGCDDLDDDTEIDDPDWDLDDDDDDGDDGDDGDDDLEEDEDVQVKTIDTETVSHHASFELAGVTVDAKTVTKTYATDGQPTRHTRTTTRTEDVDLTVKVSPYMRALITSSL